MLFSFLTVFYTKEVYDYWYEILSGQKNQKRSLKFFEIIKRISQKILSFLIYCENSFAWFFQEQVIKNLFKIELFSCLQFVISIYVKYMKIFRLSSDQVSAQMYVVLICLPRIIILISLIVDVLIYETFHYFYLCGPLYIIIIAYDYFHNSCVRIIFDWLHRYTGKLRILPASSNFMLDPYAYLEYLRHHLAGVKYHENETEEEMNTRDYSIQYEASCDREVDFEKIAERINQEFGHTILIGYFWSFEMKWAKIEIQPHLMVIISGCFAAVWGYIFIKSILIFLI